jgi:hypothetical protein
MNAGLEDRVGQENAYGTSGSLRAVRKTVGVRICER